MLKKWVLTGFLIMAAFPVLAQENGQASSLSVYMDAQVAPVSTLARHAVVMDAQTGEVLLSKDADVLMATSSMSKVLTMYLVFDAIKSGKLSLEDTVKISSKAWGQKGSRMFVREGSSVKVEDLVRGVIVQSGNDAAVALAEAVAGSEEAFASMMNEKARALGMSRSRFANASGMPDPNHYSTAEDLAKLALALLRDHSDYYHYYAEKEFTYDGIKQGNRNPLLYRNMGVDGIKTGHTDAAGYGLMAAALREGRRVVVVVNGLKSMQERADEPAKLIDWAYREYGLYRLLDHAKQAGEAKIWLGEAARVAVVPAQDLDKTLPRTLSDKVKVVVTINPETEAPIQKGQKLGKAMIEIPGEPVIEAPLVAAQDVARLGMFRVLWEKFKRMIGKA